MRCFVALLYISLAWVGCASPSPEGGTHSYDLYMPSTTYDVEASSFQDIVYDDVLGYARALNITIYRPLEAPLPLPVVLLSHGGSQGKTNPEIALVEWARRVASAGYISVVIAHPGRDQDSYDELCEYLGVSEEIQCALKINWERPHDVSRVLDWLEDKNESDELSGALGLDRVAHLGHSAGAGCSMMLVGAPRNYVCAQPYGGGQGIELPCDEADLVTKVDSRIKAILAFSNQGPAQDGFMETSFAQIEGPVLIGTGSEDGDDGEPENRTKAFELLNPSEEKSDRFLVFIDDPGAVHTLFSAELDGCAKIRGEVRCKEMRSWLYSAAIAFLDDTLKEVPEAGLWLRDGAPSTFIGADVSWSQK